MKTIRYIVPFFILLFGISSLKAQDLPDRPTPPRLVVDYSGTLSSAEVSALERKLVSFNDTTSNQILVILTNDLMGKIEKLESRLDQFFPANELR